ncbi:MAG: DNA recombination protein RmuC, partial [Bacteroidaceae bacterium]|nr:DNA recombination protein RmuC [Bacteroidaceae bacterium]
MDTNILIWLTLAAGAVVGALGTALYLQSRRHTLLARIGVLEAQCKSQEEQAETLMAAREKAHQQALEAKEDSFQQMLQEKERGHQEALQTKEESYQQMLQEKERTYQETLQAQQQHFDVSIAKVEAQMKLATDEMLKQRQREFAESSQIGLGQIVNPLRETIDKMKLAMTENADRMTHAMSESTQKQTAMSSEMKANIELMMRQSEAAKRSADELNRTFRIGNRVQGDWGETILDELLESQGLKRGIHYDTQPYIRDAAGNIVHAPGGTTMRPDIILHLDQRREVIIDSKVSLSAFIDYANATDETDRQRFLKLHIDSLKNHVRGLSAKDYSAYIQPPKARMDYVIMFVPHSAALWTALHAQPDLWRNAMAQNVFIADEQTLFAALRIINLTWTQIAQAQNHEKVYA